MVCCSCNHVHTVIVLLNSACSHTFCFDRRSHLRWIKMAQGIPKEVMMNAALVKELADVAKDAALLHGVQMRIQETPNSSEVRSASTGGSWSMNRFIREWKKYQQPSSGVATSDLWSDKSKINNLSWLVDIVTHHLTHQMRLCTEGRILLTVVSKKESGFRSVETHCDEQQRASKNLCNYLNELSEPGT